MKRMKNEILEMRLKKLQNIAISRIIIINLPLRIKEASGLAAKIGTSDVVHRSLGQVVMENISKQMQ